MSEETELVVRCEIDGVLKHKGQDELLSVKALNEFDPKLTGQSYRPEHCMSWHLPDLASWISVRIVISCSLNEYQLFWE